LEDWTNNKTYHTGAVIITKTGGNLELSVEQNSTSKETHLINEILTKEIRNILDKKSLINDTDDFIRIKFNDFNNVNRIQFLYSFTINFCIYLDFVSITDINLLLDENEESHKDVKPFLDEIDSLKYKFNINGVKDVCVIDISFPDYISKRDLNSELQISINFNVNREHRKMASETQLRKELYSYIERNKIKNYQKYRAE
jgi:hypothetical protein